MKDRSLQFCPLFIAVGLLLSCQQESQVQSERNVTPEVNSGARQEVVEDAGSAKPDLQSTSSHSEPTTPVVKTLIPESLCFSDESISFSCEVKSKQLSVCNNNNETVTYRFGTPDKIEMEINSAVHFSRTMYAAGGAGNLAFDRDSYKYVVYSKIISGERLANGERPIIESGGVYVLENEQLLADVQCTHFPGEKFISNLPPHEEEEYRYYDL